MGLLASSFSYASESSPMMRKTSELDIQFLSSLHDLMAG
jgi:hypothetical protein